MYNAWRVSHARLYGTHFSDHSRARQSELLTGEQENALAGMKELLHTTAGERDCCAAVTTLIFE